MSIFRRHPSQAQLATWLETGGPDDVTAHVDQCERCANSLERIDGQDEQSGASTTAGGRRLAQALSALWEAPADLQTRVIERVDSRVRAEKDLAVLAGLFTIGVETAQLMIPGGPESSVRSREPGADEGEDQA